MEESKVTFTGKGEIIRGSGRKLNVDEKRTLGTGSEKLVSTTSTSAAMPKATTQRKKGSKPAKLDLSKLREQAGMSEPAKKPEVPEEPPKAAEPVKPPEQAVPIPAHKPELEEVPEPAPVPAEEPAVPSAEPAIEQPGEQAPKNDEESKDVPAADVAPSTEFKLESTVNITRDHEEGGTAVDAVPPPPPQSIKKTKVDFPPHKAETVPVQEAEPLKLDGTPDTIVSTGPFKAITLEELSAKHGLGVEDVNNAVVLGKYRGLVWYRTMRIGRTNLHILGLGRELLAVTPKKYTLIDALEYLKVSADCATVNGVILVSEHQVNANTK